MRHNNFPQTGHNGDIVRSQAIAGFYLTETTYAPNINVPMHSHRHACFCLVLDGAYIELFREKAIECKPSDLIFRPADELHEDQIGNRRARCFIIETDKEWLTRLHKYSPLSEPANYKGSSLIWLAMRLRNESQQADAFTSLTVEGLMLELLAEVARGSKPILERQHPKWLEKAREILHERFSERMSLAHIAQTVGMHPVYLAGTFRQHYRCSVGEYVRRLRVEFASRELSTKDSPIAEIALASGFGDQAHFTRTFKRHTGLTPGQFRAAFRRP